MKPFRFGVSVRKANSRVEWQETARRAEGLGYSTFLVVDHLADSLSPMMALLAAAEATVDLRVGTFVLNNDFRHPVLVAREAATLDLFSDGRLELGLGAGHMEFEYRQAGFRYDPPALRVDRLSESVRIIKSLLEGKEVTISGGHYTIDEHRIYPLPLQSPRPPILIGGNGRRLLSLAAQEADIIGLLGFSHRKGGAERDLSAWTESGTAERLAIIRAAAAHRFGDLEINAFVQRVEVTNSGRSTAGELAGVTGMTVDEVLHSPYVLLGSYDNIVEALQERRQRLGISYWVVSEDSLEVLAPVVARLSGA